MRFALVVMLAGCLGSSQSTPAWPKQHTSDTDGGESLAPHVPGATAIAATTAEEEKPAAAVVTPTVTPTAAPAAATPAAATPSTEEPLQTEDIIIEIDE